MARRKAPRQVKQGGDEWLTTYGDLVTLLLTFFVLLFSFSTIDAQKWQSLVSSFAGGSGILEGGRDLGNSNDFGDNSSIDDFLELLPGGTDSYKELGDDDIENGASDEFVKLYRAIEGFLGKKGIPAEVKISDAHTEILLRFKDSILFDPGKANIKNEAKEVLDGISQVLEEFDDNISRIRIDGHADTKPVNPKRYPTNWELSTDRAVNVVRYFNEQRGIEASKLSAAGYGEYHPIYDNSTKEGMARNRRVEIFIVRVVEPANTFETVE